MSQLSSKCFWLLISAKLADFVLKPRQALTHWSCAPAVEHKPPEKNDSKQLGSDPYSFWKQVVEFQICA